MDGVRESKERRGWGSLIMVYTGSSLSHPIGSEKVLHHIIWLWKHTDSFMAFIYHQEQAENPPRCDPNLLSDRVSQRGTDGQSKKRLFLLYGDWSAVTVSNHSLTCFSLSLDKSKLVCEEVNVDRFFPVLYPKVRSGFAFCSCSWWMCF